MPGLVKTKNLKDQPGLLQRLAIQAAMLIAAPTPETADEKVVAAIGRARGGDVRDHYFSGAKDKGTRDLKASKQDIDAIWDLSTTATNPWLD